MRDNKGGLSSPMSMQLPVDRDGDRRDMHDTNDQELAFRRDKAKRDPANDFQENLNNISYVGPVNRVAKDVLSGPMQGPRCAATGLREAELSKKQGY